jgi:hypothetical protein
MSWWVGVEVDTGGPEPAQLSDRSVTYNYSPLFHEVLGEDGLRGLHGVSCADAAPRLSAALRTLLGMTEQEQAALIRGDGRWGNPMGAWDALRWLLEQAQAHPRATIYIH